MDDKYASTGEVQYGGGGFGGGEDPFGEEGDGGMEFVSVGGAFGGAGGGMGMGGVGDFGPIAERADDSDAVDASALMGISPAATRAVRNIHSHDDRYLPTQHRSMAESFSQTVGLAYLAAGSGAGMVGFVSGIARARSYRARILINSILNNTTRMGSKVGNTAGVLAMVYSGSVAALDHLEFDKLPPRVGLPRRDVYTPIAAGGITAFLFRAPAMRLARPVTVATALLSGLFGAGLVAGVAAAGPSLLGSYAPLEWE